MKVMVDATIWIPVEVPTTEEEDGFADLSTAQEKATNILKKIGYQFRIDGAEESNHGDE